MIKKTLYFGNPAYLSLRLQQLVIKLPEVEKLKGLAEVVKKEFEVTRPIEDIGLVVLDHKQITVTQGLLDALLENNCAIVTCDSHSMPVGLMLPLCGNILTNNDITGGNSGSPMFDGNGNLIGLAFDGILLKWLNTHYHYHKDCTHHHLFLNPLLPLRDGSETPSTSYHISPSSL